MDLGVEQAEYLCLIVSELSPSETKHLETSSARDDPSLRTKASQGKKRKRRTSYKGRTVDA